MDETDSLNLEPNDKSDEWKSWPPTRFLATMLHELRTPIMIIKGYTELLANEETKELHPKAIEAISQAISMLDVLWEDTAEYYGELMRRSHDT